MADLGKVDFSNLREKLRSFNFQEVFLWLQITASHPCNLLYSIQFDALTALLLSIPEKEFSGAPFNREDCQGLCKYVREKYGAVFVRFEDFKPFEQLKLIPYFFEGRKHYFFYGGLERPYEYLRQFHNMYLYRNSDAEPNELNVIRSVFKASLEFQDKVLRVMQEKDESRVKPGNLYVPSQGFFDDFSRLFRISSQQKNLLKGLGTLAPGALLGHIDKLEDKLLTCGLFETFRVGYADKEEFFIWPGRHIETLFAFANKLIRKSENISEIRDAVHRNSIELLKRFCAQFFSVRSILLDIYSAPPSENLTQPIDMIGVVDGGKVFLFKVVQPDYDLDITDCIKDTMSSLQNVKENINKEDIVGFLHHSSPDKLAGVPTSVIEIFTIAVLTRTTLDAQIMRTPGITEDEHTHIFNIIDLQPMFEILPTPLSFLKFLRNDWELRKKSRMVSIDYLDRFASYMENGESYPRHGKSMHAIMFASHWWSDYYNHWLYQKYTDDIHELIEKHFPRQFNYVDKTGDKIYNVADTAFLDAGVAVKFHKTLIFVSLPSDLYYCKEDEVRSSEFLSNLYSYYFDKLQEPLSEFFERHEITLEEFYNIWILPVSYIEREKINYLKREVSKVNKDNPIVVISGRVKDTLNLRTCTIYDPDYLSEVFGGEDNSGERYCFGRLVRSLLRYFNPLMPEADIETEVKEFLNKHIPVGIKAYAYEAHYVENPKADEYRGYASLSKAESARVDCEIARFVRDTEISPGEYSGEAAQKILGSIYDFLQDRLENQISKYDNRFLYYAYQQLEYIEGKRQQKLAQAGLHMSKYTEFDVTQRNFEETPVLGKAAVSVRHIITTVLKVGFNGNAIPDTESWNYLHALSSTIQDISGIYQYVKYDILPHTIAISELFEIQYLKGEEIFNQSKFYRAEAERRVESAKEKYIRQSNSTHEKVEASKELLQFLTKLDTAFEIEYGFKYQDMLVTLYSLGKCDIPSGIHSPMNILSEESLLKYLQNTIVKDCPSEKCLRRILRFVSLDFESYQSEEQLFYTQLLRRKERLNLCPVIRISPHSYLHGNEMCLGAVRLWSNFVSEGSFPYGLKESSSIFESIEKYRRNLDKKLEKKAEEIVSEALGKANVEANIANFKRLSRSFRKRPSCGEIDLLVVNKNTKTLFLFDAKNRPRRIRPYDIRQDVDTFLRGKKSYLRKLVAKERFITQNFSEVLQHFSIANSKGWTIRKAFVVAHHYQVAYYTKKSVDFVEIEYLKSYVTE